MLISPLQQFQKSLGASFAAYGEWELAAQFASVEEEHLAVNSFAGLIDRSHRARLVISGMDRISWLQGMVSNDVRRLERADQSINACLLNATGHMLADLTVVYRGESVLVDLDWEVRQQVFDLLNHYIITEDVEIVDQSDFLACITVQGPAATRVVESLPEEYSTVICEARHSCAGGYDIYLRSTVAEGLYSTLTERGAVPVGELAANILRVEAGIPQYGVDMDETTIPLEAGLEATHISYTKGCYVGQEIIARIQSRGHTNRDLTGFLVIVGELPDKGARILADIDGSARDVGWVTSAVRSPVHGPIALGYLRHDAREAGDNFTTDRGARVQPTILPFRQEVTSAQ